MVESNDDGTSGSEIGTGLALGIAIGVATDNLALWLPTGVAIGVGIGAAFDGDERVARTKPAVTDG